MACVCLLWASVDNTELKHLYLTSVVKSVCLECLWTFDASTRNSIAVQPVSVFVSQLHDSRLRQVYLDSHISKLPRLYPEAARDRDDLWKCRKFTRLPLSRLFLHLRSKVPIVFLDQDHPRSSGTSHP